jgi:hypothetical protein
MLYRALAPACLILVLPLLSPAPAQAQTMQQILNGLFVFGEGEDPLFLAGTAGQEATVVHGDHFIPASSQANNVIIDFFNASLATNVANFPLSSTVASQTFKFVGGVPTPTSNSFGPVLAERAQTVGRGRLNAGFNYSRLRFSEIRGVDLEDIKLAFVHQNADFPGCDEVFQGDCTLLGIPPLENDLITLDLKLDIVADVFAFYTTFGLTDWLDLSVAVPVIDFRLQGSSLASVIPSSNPPFHFFGGTQDNPELTARSQVFGDATGIGDIAGRVKALIVSSENWNLGILAEARAPTGREEDFLGTGDWNAKGLLIISGTFSDFSPHTNVGYEYRGSPIDQDELEVIAGFDHKLADWATLAVDFLGAFKVGEQAVTFPADVMIEAPFRRIVDVTNIPEIRDDIIDGSIGFKFRTQGGLIIITNVLVPLNDGGLRSGPTPTVGLEYTL